MLVCVCVCWQFLFYSKISMQTAVKKREKKGDTHTLTNSADKIGIVTIITLKNNSTTQMNTARKRKKERAHNRMSISTRYRIDSRNLMCIKFHVSLTLSVDNDWTRRHTHTHTLIFFAPFFVLCFYGFCVQSKKEKCFETHY